MEDGILVSLNFSYFNTYVECIKGKYTKIKKNGASGLLNC